MIGGIIKEGKRCFAYCGDDRCDCDANPRNEALLDDQRRAEAARHHHTGHDRDPAATERETEKLRRMLAQQPEPGGHLPVDTEPTPTGADWGAPGGWLGRPLPPPEHDPRAAGQVMRYHTWQHVRAQSVGEHTHQLMRLVLTVDPGCRREVLLHVLCHDLGERRTGDLPYPVKRDMGAGRSAIDAIEQGALAEMVEHWMLPRPPCLQPGEKLLVKHCEYLEMMEWALGELELGNRHAQVVHDRCLRAYNETTQGLAEDCRQRSALYLRKRARQHQATMGAVL